MSMATEAFKGLSMAERIAILRPLVKGAREMVKPLAEALNLPKGVADKLVRDAIRTGSANPLAHLGLQANVTIDVLRGEALAGKVAQAQLGFIKEYGNVSHQVMGTLGRVENTVVACDKMGVQGL